MPNNSPLQSWLVPVLAVFSLVLLAIAIVFKVDLLSRLTELPQKVTDHVKVESVLHELNVRVLIMQTSRRGFLSSMREEHLTAFEGAATEARSLMLQLRAAINAAEDARHVDKLEELLPVYEAHLRRSIRLRIEQPDNQAEQNKLTDNGVALSRQLINALGGAGSQLNSQLKNQVDEVEVAAGRAETTEAVLAGITLATVALGFGVAAAQMRQRAAVQRQLEVANQTLEQKVQSRTAQLSESEHRYRSLVELSVDAVLLVQKNGTVSYANPAARALLKKLGRKAVEGQAIDTLLGIFSSGSASKALDALWKAPSALPYSTALLHGPQGLEVPVQWSAASHAAVDAVAGEPAHDVRDVQIVLHDLTDLRRTEAAAQDRLIFIDQLLEAIPAPVSMRDERGRFMQVNAAFESAYGLPRDRLLQHTPSELLPGATGWELMRQDATAIRTLQPVAYEFQRPGADSQMQDVLAHVSSIQRIDGSVQGVVTVETDITPLRRKEQDLSRANQELARLSADLRETQERERRHIARELHDQVGQIMTALKLSIGQLAVEAGVAQTALQKRLDIVDEALRHTRTLSRNLHPHVLEDLGLAAGLESLVEQYAGPGSPAIALDLRIEPLRGHPDQELTAYRVAQEALTNALRHAGASTLRIQAACEGGWLGLSVSDDGKGFTASDKATSSLGLVSMRERLHDLGGELHIDSAPAAGTTVRAWLPWSPVADSSASSHSLSG
jgi:two-component system, NarL family, sensor histidine kinase UhpB